MKLTLEVEFNQVNKELRAFLNENSCLKRDHKAALQKMKKKAIERKTRSKTKDSDD